MTATQNSVATIGAAALDKEYPARGSVRFSWGEACVWVVLIVGVFIAFLYIRAFAVDVIWMDEWAFIPYLQQFNEGKLNFGEFLQWQHNEHRLFIPLIMLFAVVRCTSYDGIAVQYLSLAIMAITAVLVVLLARQRLLGRPFGKLMLALIAGFVLNLRQWENLVSGFSAATVAVSMFFVLAVCILDKVRKLDWRIWVAALVSFCGTYSFGNGLLTWPIGIFVLAFSKKFENAEDRKKLTLPLIIWSILGGLVWFFYFWHYAGNPKKDLVQRVPTLFYPEQVWNTVEAFFAALANPLAITFEIGGAVAIGIALFAILCFVAVAVCRKKWEIKREAIAPLALFLFSMLSTALIFLGRAADGAQQLLVPRYTSITCLGIIGLFLFVSGAIASDTNKKAAILACLAYAMFTTTIGSAIYALDAGKNIKAIRLEAAQILKNYKRESDERLKTIMPYPEWIRLYAPIVEQQGYSVFKHK